MATDPLRAVLFACNYNHVRSPMAAALLQRAAGPGLEVESCGVRSAEELDPFVVCTMEEVGIDLSGQRPRSIDSLDPSRFDLVVALTPEAHARVRELPGVAALEYWPTQDPTQEDGARDMRLEAYRVLRRDLERRIGERFQADAAAR